ncbi:hypothetical protein [Xanthobacter tagetidis]|uniref:Uncharacterized protein n=1 Tax=Xanthobacter tagetidis TaxID=60216 RepID=A0A3L7ANZ4_9HYPH|nr:hypothetical protein [Xanthobacter tagetidis]MBB6308244.1 PHD/YefM family antitoxin component YafN of YafNO toxin-antitoxin module [Xanthobacter tagetidis]RLP81854.1 hypothetical protein D9R14_02370 [Xanthobacter tagetidis]
MVSADMVERVARAMHAFSQQRYPLLEPWEQLAPERRAYQRQLAAHALQALTPHDIVVITTRNAPEIAALPMEPNPWALAELQEAAISDNGTAADARRRYRSLLATACMPLAMRHADEGATP